MIHTKIDGTNDRVIILLHGTGGDELSLVDIARYLDPKATLIGVRGNIEENEMYRFFERYTDGTFNVKSLMKETKLLYEGIQDALVYYGLEDKKVILLGYSNGANIALNILKEYETTYDTALLFHTSAVKEEIPFKQQKHMAVQLSYGTNDPFTTKESFDETVAAMEKAGIHVEVIMHESGHQLIEEELIKAKELLLSGRE